MYKGCTRYLVMSHVRHVYVLQPPVRLHVRHTHLGLHIAVSLKGKQLAFGYLVMVLLVLLQWDMLDLDYYLVKLLFYNYLLLLNDD